MSFFELLWTFLNSFELLWRTRKYFLLLKLSSRINTFTKLQRCNVITNTNKNSNQLHFANAIHTPNVTKRKNSLNKTNKRNVKCTPLDRGKIPKNNRIFISAFITQMRSSNKQKTKQKDVRKKRTNFLLLLVKFYD